MSRKLTPPMAQIPIGVATFNGQQVEVRQHPEFVRFFFDLFARVGSTDALSNAELEAMTQALIDAGAVPASSTEAQEALRGVEELRQALASMRGDNDRLRGEVDELRAQIEAAPTLQPLTSRVQQIEDRLQ
tara:strand:- start:5646 stop:6038 length:393 start_codon:yes stop_codon:yes gene_type:complete